MNINATLGIAFNGTANITLGTNATTFTPQRRDYIYEVKQSFHLQTWKTIKTLFLYKITGSRTTVKSPKKITAPQ